MHPPDSLSKHGRDIQDLQLRADLLMLVLGDRVGHYDFVDTAGVDPRDRISAEDAVGDENDDFESALALEELGSTSDCVGGVDDVVNEDTDAISDVANEHHAGVALFRELDRAAFLYMGEFDHPEVLKG